MPDTSITEYFGDGEYTFFLPMAQVCAAESEMTRKVSRPRSVIALYVELNEALLVADDESQMHIVASIPSTIFECRSIIRNALQGGAQGLVGNDVIIVNDAMAARLVETYCFPARPALHDLNLARKILKAAIEGVDLKKKEEQPAETLSPSDED